MSNYPNPPGTQTTYAYTPPPTNGLGIAGFVVSLSGLIICFGLISPIGLLLSLIALAKEPRGYAIAGSIIGFLGSILGVLAILVVSGFVGSGIFSTYYYQQSPTEMAMDSASYSIDQYFMNNSDTLPDEPTGNSIVSMHFDEWNNAIKYTPIQGSTSDYTFTSARPDGVMGNFDDITSYYTAYNYNYNSPQVQTGPYDPDDYEEEEVEENFNYAARQIVKAFPPGTPLPARDQVENHVYGLNDLWLTPMHYIPTDNPPWYTLRSAGPDRQWNTGDDISKTFYFEAIGETDGPQ